MSRALSFFFFVLLVAAAVTSRPVKNETVMATIANQLDSNSTAKIAEPGKDLAALENSLDVLDAVVEIATGEDANAIPAAATGSHVATAGPTQCAIQIIKRHPFWGETSISTCP
ncbi:hypothetical protein SELMODRAFT_409681 [Selaginella moellendorffii]|uniref:Pectinesterase inhibitor domain-containing protein n=1 Tax=Selaginella moellendorffii TaxID=88036 RepID=D8RC37_SELML|nr:hypothetical protein SELMODRAFT_409681 [Selaginella moellendorffii]